MWTRAKRRGFTLIESCEYQRSVVVAACSLYQASLVIAGGTAAFPAAYNDPELYAAGDVPSCPSGGVWTYSAAQGRITACSVHGLFGGGPTPPPAPPAQPRRRMIPARRRMIPARR